MPARQCLLTACDYLSNRDVGPSRPGQGEAEARTVYPFSAVALTGVRGGRSALRARSGQRAAVLDGQCPGRLGVRSGRRHEHRGPVEAQLLDALLDVGQGTVVAGLRRRVEVGAWVPAAGQLLDRGHVHDPVVQERLQARHVPRQERPVRGHGVAGERGPAAVGTVVLDVGEDLLLGVGERDPCVQLVEQPRGGVHGADEVVHLVERLGWWLDHDVDALTEHVELEIGDERRDLDEGIRPQVQPGHLTVDPHQTVIHVTNPTQGALRERSYSERVGRFGGAIGVLCRVVLGGVFLVAGLLKLPEPAANVRAVRAYRLLPESVVAVVSHGLPILEILLGACLILGLVTRVAAVVSAVLLTAFVVGIGSAWARGLSIECGCFGGGAGPSANASAAYPWEIARDVGLLLAAGWLVWRPSTPWAIDNRLVTA